MAQRPDWMSLRHDLAGNHHNPHHGAGAYRDSPVRSGSGRLPPLEDQRVFMDKAAMGPRVQYDGLPAAISSSHAGLEPLNIAMHYQGRAQMSLEERLMRLESRVASTEGAVTVASSGSDAANGRLHAIMADMGRTQAEVSDLRSRYEGAVAASAALQHQVSAMSAELRGTDGAVAGLRHALSESQAANHELRAQLAMVQEEVARGTAAAQQTAQAHASAMQAELRAADARTAALSAQLGDVGRVNAELSGQVAVLSDAVQRASAERAAASAAIDALSRQFQEGASAIVEEQRRTAAETDAAFRAESQRRQAAYLQDLASLNREIEGYRAEAGSAGAALHSAVSQLSARLQSEEAGLNLLQADAQRAAAAEAEQLNSLRGQVMELQGLLNGMGQQLAGESHMRRADASSFDANMRQMEAQLQAAQDAAVQRTVHMIEAKAANLLRALRDADDAAADRDEDNRMAGELQLSTVARANASKERATIERLLVLEAALRDIAAGHSSAIQDMQSRIDKGVTELARVLDDARRNSDERESNLREQINAALSKVRAYARDMEESLEQERIRLEEVVKMEIRARISGSDKIVADVKAELDGVRGELSSSKLALEQASATLRADVDAIVEKLEGSVVAQLQAGIDSAARGVRDEAAARDAALAGVQREIEGLVVDQKVAEEAARAEMWALGASIDATAARLSDEVAPAVSAAAADLAKLKAGLRSEAAARGELAELVGVHGDVFADVQKKLAGQLQRIKTHDMQLAEVWEAMEDKVGALGEGLAQQAKDMEAHRAALVAEVDKQLMAAEQASRAAAEDAALQAASAQHVFETVLAEVQEEVEARLGELGDSVKANEVLLQEELARVEGMVEAAAAAAATAAHQQADSVNEALGAMAARVDGQMAEADGKLDALRDETHAALSAAERGVDELLAAADEKARANMAATKASIVAALVEQREETAGRLEVQSAKLAEAVAMVESLSEETSEKLRSQEEAFGERINELSATTDGALSGFKDSMQEVLAAAQAQVEAAVAASDARAAAAEARLDSALAETASGNAEAVEAIKADLEGLRQRADASDETAAQLGDVATELQAGLSELRAETAEKLVEYRNRTREELSSAADDTERMLQEAAADVDAKVAAAQEAVAAVRTETSSALASVRAELNDKAVHSADSAAAQIKEQRAEVDAAIADAAASAASLVAQNRAELEAALANTRDNVAAQLKEQRDQVAEEAVSASVSAGAAQRAAVEQAAARLDALSADVEALRSAGADAGDAESRFGQLAADISSLREGQSEQTREMANAMEEAAAAVELARSVEARVQALEGSTTASLERAADRLSALESSGRGVSRDDLEAARAEAREAANAAQREALAEAAVLLDARAAAITDGINSQVETQMRAFIKGDAVEDLQARMHAALDAGLDTMRNEVARQIEASQA
uniref:Uncharacterized protein n=1 Tax=Chlamydomonas euryale TaxID=1486919 RepID=A0A7R9V3G3_9CHLO|mmetsp:Transcript_15914/g.47165  ORF Transcript_15914/g.47165 Transcript_15914/m.47165 type:complete len:1434 (+) Transcript_15914:365-4666(+)